jgi:hypothetical protein
MAVAFAALALVAALGRGFSDIRQAAAGIFLSSADGTVRRVEGDALPVAAETGSAMYGLAVSSDGQLVAAVGER